MTVGYHINKFRLLKAFQLLVTIICGVLEAAEFIAYSNYVDNVNSSKLYNTRLSKLQYFENTQISKELRLAITPNSNFNNELGGTIEEFPAVTNEHVYVTDHEPVNI
ncbi:6818_t:CDS:2 [Scutellospora calospora]|uniref:6818_t:CDS:1 n=1 Tax=Scutellospora calospora TaxID=85575 RepID=A0ACA9KS83_9GLOM|nr:6818_t:CDS:2 [Scutellospora calospora]